jgi:hypothetical protein
VPLPAHAAETPEVTQRPPGSGHGQEVDVTCLETGIAEPDVEEFIQDAIRVFEQTGRDPNAFRMELRQEDPQGSDFRALGAELVTSIVFIPRTANDLYPVRVSIGHPCVVSWLWQPDSFTSWQRRVLRRAREVAADAWTRLGNDRLVDVEVLESRDAVFVHLWRVEETGQSSDAAELSVTLNKADLELVDTR